MKADEAVDLQTEQLIAQVSGNPRAMLMLARTLLVPKGKMRRALELSETALELAPDDGEVTALAQAIRSRVAGAWYFTMVQDQTRHALYARAFRKICTPACTVLDIGAGTGLFAMLAVREGAAKVFACERDPTIAAVAREIVERNGYSDQITVIAKESRELEVGVDLDGPVDVLLWDNLSNDLVGVGGLDTIEDARRRLVKPGARLVPRRCEVRVALARTTPAADSRMGLVEGFDMTPFNRFRPSQFTIGRNRFERGSSAATIFDFDFTQDELARERTDQVTVTASGGNVDGIVQWLRFQLADDITYDTGDDEGVTAFGVQYHAIEPFEPERGQEVTIGGSHDRMRTWFWVGRN